MSYNQNVMVNGNWKALCPASNPVMLPAITYNITWPITTDGTAGWKLASDMGQPGASAHGDYVEGLSEKLRVNMVNNCLKIGKDCGGL
jgi:hypothetical protein